jgi:hypothetical protein
VPVHEEAAQAIRDLIKLRESQAGAVGVSAPGRLQARTQFEGKAAGEVFNCTGKTDILVREGDRNVFIGECKIFDPKEQAERGPHRHQRS